MLGESDDGRRLHAAGVGDVAYAHDDHLLAMLGDVLRDEFELLGEIVVFAGDPLNQILNPVGRSQVMRYPPLDKLRAIVAQHDFGIPLA